jgi:tetratricopeptide (TPR) repeat protein
MNRRFLIITSCLFSLVNVAGNVSPAFATKLNAKPLPSERELKDFENSQSSAPDVSRFSRRMDYRDAEKAKKDQAEAAKKDAIERASQAQKDQEVNAKKTVQAALDANNRAVALGKQGRWTEAIQEHETACQLQPANKQYRINLSAARCTFGEARLSAKDYNAASGLFRKALAAAPDNGLATKLLNETLKKQGHDPNVVEERVALGDQLLAANDLESALVEYQTALQLESSARTFCKMGDVALRCNQPTTAANWYGQALVKDPNFAPAHRQMGLVRMQLRDQTGAAASLRKALILDSKDALAGQMLVEIWRRQVSTNPLLGENHLGLAGALQLTGDFNGAEDEYNKLATLEPNNPGLAAGRASLTRARQHGMSEKHKLAAETLFNQGLRREALAEIGQAVMMEPKNARYQFLLGECLEANGDLRGAHQAYMTCVLIDPEKNQEAAFRLKEMQRGATLAGPAPAMQALPQVQQSMQQHAPQQMQQQFSAQPQAPMQQAQAPMQQAPMQKNVFEGGNGIAANSIAKTQSGFSTHNESDASAQAGNAQTVGAQMPAQMPAAMPAQVPAAAAKPAEPEVGAEVVAKLNACESAKDYEGAVSTLREVLTHNLQSPDIHHRLAVDLLATGNVTEAIAEFRIASALRPTSKDFASDLAQALEIHKRSQGAFDDAAPNDNKKVAER